MLLISYLMRKKSLQLQIYFQQIASILWSISLICFFDIKIPLRFSLKIWYLIIPFILLNLFVNDTSISPLLLKFIPVVLFLAPISEELFFRGVLLNLIGLNLLGALITALIFTLFHIMNVISSLEKPAFYPLIIRFILGLLLGVSVIKNAGSILPAIFYHFLINLSALISLKKRYHMR